MIDLFDTLSVHQNRQFEKALFSLKSTGSSNLYFEMMYSIVALRVKIFFAIVKWRVGKNYTASSFAIKFFRKRSARVFYRVEESQSFLKVVETVEKIMRTISTSFFSQLQVLKETRQLSFHLCYLKWLKLRLSCEISCITLG